jgi:hypothetical protein
VLKKATEMHMCDCMRKMTMCAVLVLAACGADGTQEPGSGSAESTILGGTKLSEARVVEALRKAQFDDNLIPTMVCIAKFESSFFTGARNHNSNGTTDYGLFQINSIWERPCSANSSQLMDPDTNANCAGQVYDAQGFEAWYGYKKHRYTCDHYMTDLSASAPTMTVDDSQNDNTMGRPCLSATMGETEDEGTCVLSSSDNSWYQCQNGQWFQPVSSDFVGPRGACTQLCQCDANGNNCHCDPNGPAPTDM